MNPPPYANWSARVAYHFSPEWSAQLGFWRSNAAFPFTDGLEGWKGSVTLPGGVVLDKPNNNLFLGNLVYQTGPKTDPYPKYCEAVLYHNDGTQTNPLTGEMHKGTNGLYVGGRQKIWRESDNPMATSVSLYGSLFSSFDSSNSHGLQNGFNAGITLHGPFASRPLDSYSLKFAYNRLTSDAAAYLAADNIILQLWVNYVWKPKTPENPTAYGNPRNGMAVGFTVVVLAGKALDL